VLLIYEHKQGTYIQKEKKEGNSDYFQKSPEENDKDLIHYVND
jgi:hypothetical protein